MEKGQEQPLSFLEQLPTTCVKCCKNFAGNIDLEKGVYYVPAEYRYFQLKAASRHTKNARFDCSNTIFYCPMCTSALYLERAGVCCKLCNIVQVDNICPILCLRKNYIRGSYTLGNFKLLPSAFTVIGHLQNGDPICTFCVKNLVKNNLVQMEPGSELFKDEIEATKPLPERRWDEERQVYVFKMGEHWDDGGDDDGNATDQNNSYPRWPAIAGEDDIDDDDDDDDSDENDSIQQSSPQPDKTCGLCGRMWDPKNVKDFPPDSWSKEWNYFTDPTHYQTSQSPMILKEPIQPLNSTFPLEVCNICISSLSSEPHCTVPCRLCGKKYLSTWTEKDTIGQNCSFRISHGCISMGGSSSKYSGNRFKWSQPLMPARILEIYRVYWNDTIICDTCIEDLIRNGIIYAQDE